VGDRDAHVAGRDAQGLQRFGDAGLHGRTVEHDEPVIGSVVDDAAVGRDHPAHQLRRRGRIREVQRVHLDDPVVGRQADRAGEGGRSDDAEDDAQRTHAPMIRSKLVGPNILHYDARS